MQFPNGVVKKTWAFGHSRTGREVKIEEVLEKNTLSTAILSAFQWDIDWVLSKVNSPATKLIFVMQAKEKALRDQMLDETKDMRGYLRLCFPPMDGQIFCMHSKLMLLFHPHKLRVAIPSANLMKYDWGETGVMENSVFMIDLPRLEENVPQDPSNLPSFGKELLHFLEKQHIPEDARNGVLKFDFAAAKHLAFVHTVGGVTYGNDMQRTGFLGLSKAVTEHELATQPDLQVDFCASSIGSLTHDFVRTMHDAARGEASVPSSAPSTSSRKAGSAAALKRADANERFRLYFPTLETVAASSGGVANGGTICLQRKYWEGNNAFPHACFRDFRSVRPGLLSHNKILYARGHGKAAGARDEGRCGDVAWAYVGSANMSESAWGKLVWDRSRKEWKMNCRNWECGVLIAVPDGVLRKAKGHVLGGSDRPGGSGAGRDIADDETDSEGEEEEEEQEETDTAVRPGTGEKGKKEEDVAPDPVVGMAVFEGLVDVPFEFPGRLYEGREPWYFMEPH